MTRRTFPLVVLLGATIVVPIMAAQTTPATQAVAPAAAEEQWPPAGVLRMADGIQAPTVVTQRKPSYTAEAMRAQIQGMVEVQAIVKTDGTVGEVRVVKSLDKESGLDDAAVAAVKEWTFRPGRTKDGQTVPVLVNIELTFSVRKR